MKIYYRIERRKDIDSFIKDAGAEGRSTIELKVDALSNEKTMSWKPKIYYRIERGSCCASPAFKSYRLKIYYRIESHTMGFSLACQVLGEDLL
ncbi:hypothetical protein ATG_15410 [Desulfurococcaceae archaeon AG1]|nr:hypothetical protein ATG_15410 [Desulfurococcaceae archaeon AG1]